MTHVFNTITINASAEASDRLPLKLHAEDGLVFADHQVAGVFDAGDGEVVGDDGREADACTLHQAEDVAVDARDGEALELQRLVVARHPRHGDIRQDILRPSGSARVVKVYATRSYTAPTGITGIIGGPSQTHAELYGEFLGG